MIKVTKSQMPLLMEVTNKQSVIGIEKRFFKKFYLFMAVLGLHCFVWLSLVAVSGGHSSLWCSGSHCGCFSCCRARALGTRASVVAHSGLVVVARGF